MGITLVLVLHILKITIFATISGEYRFQADGAFHSASRIREEFVKVIIGLA